MVANIGETISCVVLPMRSTGGLLLPASALVEVIDSDKMNVVVDLQSGVLGKMQWKSTAIHLMSFEAAAGLVQAAFNAETKAAIIRVPLEGSALRYLAFATYGAPRVIQLSYGHIKEIPEEDQLENPLAESRVQVEGQLLWMPDMAAVVEHINNQAV